MGRGDLGGHTHKEGRCREKGEIAKPRVGYCEQELEGNSEFGANQVVSSDNVWSWLQKSKNFLSHSANDKDEKYISIILSFKYLGRFPALMQTLRRKIVVLCGIPYVRMMKKIRDSMALPLRAILTGKTDLERRTKGFPRKRENFTCRFSIADCKIETARRTRKYLNAVEIIVLCLVLWSFALIYFVSTFLKAEKLF